MTLLDAKPPKPRTGWRRYVSLPLLIIILVLAAIPMTYRLWNIREEHAVSRFLTALEHGNYQEAYRLWQPSPSYSFSDFMHDWGSRGDYGQIREFEILGSKSRGSTTVIVTVRINRVDPPLQLLVDRRTLGLAYSPF